MAQAARSRGWRGDTVRWLAAPLLLLSLTSCIARSEGELRRQTEDDAGPIGPVLDAGLEDARFNLPDAAPHAVLAVSPPHGPWRGGQLATLRGNGFSSAARVWIGGVELPASDVLAVDPTRLQVTIPPGEPGPQLVVVQNGEDSSTRAELSGGYSYDAFYADPPSGPTSGGTRVRLLGKGTQWEEGTEVLVDLKPCTDVTVVSEAELECSVPAGTPGGKNLRVTTPDGVAVDVLDGYLYGDSDNGFRGGLSGGPLGQTLKVLVLDDYTGQAINNALVILGSELASATQLRTSAKGLAQATGELGPRVTVTVGTKCYQPVTFVDVPVDTVTAYLRPVLSVDCIDDGDPPPVGGSPSYGANLAGELVWQGGREFEKASWTNVPEPSSPGEVEAAYLFRFTADPTREFTLPAEAARITPTAPGSLGYSFAMSTGAGNLSLYALAGIENRTLSPPTFVAYAMGVVRGISAKPAGSVEGVYISMNIPLDHAITLRLGSPSPTPKGPDRVRASVAVRYGNEGYALFPAGSRTELLPLRGDVTVVGVPPLGGDLLGSAYVAGARAFTGPSDLAPRSVIGLRGQTSSAVPVDLTGFVQVPQLVSPRGTDAWGGEPLVLDWAAGGASVDLVVVDVLGSSGLVQWTIAAPTSSFPSAGEKPLRVPELAALPELGLRPGPVTAAITLAHIPEFNYGSLRYRQLTQAGWAAHATDVATLRISAP